MPPIATMMPCGLSAHSCGAGLPAPIIGTSRLDPQGTKVQDL